MSDRIVCNHNVEVTSDCYACELEARKYHNEMLETLTRCQAECTKLVNEKRALQKEYDEEVASHDIEGKDWKRQIEELRKELDAAEQYRRDHGSW